MTLKEILKNRTEFLETCRDDFEFVTEFNAVTQMLPFMLDSKLVDSAEFNESFLISSSEGLKLNSYSVSETGERLQLVLVDESTIKENVEDEEILVSERSVYEGQLNRGVKFLKSAIKGGVKGQLQDSDPCMALVNKLSLASGLAHFDVVEIFLISLTATVSFKASVPQPKTLHFKDDFLSVKLSQGEESVERKILVKRRVIDANFLTNALDSRGRGEPLEVRFKDDFLSEIEVIKAAEEKHFESYLCVLEAKVLYELYRSYGTRLLEKNVRSFLNFRGVNSGIRQTIRDEPEKFVAYNNGVTITAEKVELYNYKKKTFLGSLTDLQIVNGGQTTATIYFSKKEGLDISRVKVMAKINVAKTGDNSDLDELISNISKFSNTQSRVSPVDLRARNPQLIQLQKLSKNIRTPSGYLWFFERAKGEFNTLVRKAGSGGNRLKKEFPKERKFTKEDLAKYFTAWGDQPWLVKKGGEKCFRFFIERLSGEEGHQAPKIDRDFYEDLVSKIILFRRLEKIYGIGKNAMGNLRAVVIPYSLAIVYCATDAQADKGNFDLGAVWKGEDIDGDLAEFFQRLMLLMNDLIKKYSLSDDYGEYSKKPELWAAIKSSSEILSFQRDPQNSEVLERWTN